MKFLSIQAPIDEEGFKNIEKNELTDLVYKSCYENYKLKSEIIAQSTFSVIENVYKSHSGHYKNIVIPFSDGVKTMNVVTNLEEAYEIKENIQFSIEKSITLSIIDDIWKEHLKNGRFKTIC